MGVLCNKHPTTLGSTPHILLCQTSGLRRGSFTFLGGGYKSSWHDLNGCLNNPLIIKSYHDRKAFGLGSPALGPSPALSCPALPCPALALPALPLALPAASKREKLGMSLGAKP